MPASNIKINGVAASNDDLPLNTLVSLDNLNVGGETAFLWAIVDQPPGAADALSSTTIQNPTFTPKKEGTYLLKLIVNGTLVNTKIVGIRQLKSRERVPAAGETTENSASRGWSGAVGSFLQQLEMDTHDMGIFAGVISTGAPAVAVGAMCRAGSTETLKLGLPGQENIAGWRGTTALTLPEVDQMLAICVGAVDGSAGPYNPGKLVMMRLFGHYEGLTGVPAAVGDPVYVSDAGAIVLAPGTVARQIGNVVRFGGGTYDVWMDGTYGASLSLTAAAPQDILKQTASAGVATTAAKADHKHQIQTAAPGGLIVGLSNFEGAATSLARSDHSHSIALTSQQYNAATSSATITSPFPTFIQLDPPGCVIALPGAGVYLINFGCNFSNSANNQNNYFQLHAGAGFPGTVIPNTLRQNRVNTNNIPASMEISVMYTAVAATNIYVGAAVGANTMTVTEHNLLALRIQ